MIIKTGKTPFADYAGRWMDSAQLAAATRARYGRLLGRINTGIGHIPIERLSVDHVEVYLKGLREDSRLSEHTIRHHHAVIRAILSGAKKARIIPYNVAREFMDAPRAKCGEARYLDDNGARGFLSALAREEDIRVRTALTLALFTGIRRGELCGLSWQDIDFGSGIVRIRKSSLYIAGEGVIEVPLKTRSSARSITVSPFVTELLREYRDWWNEKTRLSEQKTDRLFINNECAPIFPGTINFWLSRFTKQNGLPHLNPHALRHTFITLQITAGVDLRTLQARSGHSQASTLLNVYSHVVQSAQDRAVKALDAVLLGE
jgi:integrase